VRTFLVATLIGLLVSCPAVCGAAEAGHGSHGHREPSGSPGDPRAPVHCPEDGEDCICNGAVLAGDVRLPDSDPDRLTPLLAFVVPPARHLVAHHLTPDSAPTGLAGRGDSRAVRAFLQNFRC
jgi:hypothetical protein